MSSTTVPSTPDVDVEALRCEIRKEYAEVAVNPQRGFHFHTGRALAAITGYDDALLSGIPESAIESFAGTGNPFSMGALSAGEHVVDLGPGAGMDSLIAARMIGADGRVIGVDMTREMLDKAAAAARQGGYDNVEFREGLLESLPIDDEWADVIISNGVINLCPDKQATFAEIHRVLKPGGRLQIADIMVQKPVSEDAKRNIDLWKGWVAGALLEAELAAVVSAAGFKDFEVTWEAPVFEGAPQQSSAAYFGTQGINFRATKPPESGSERTSHSSDS